LVLMAASLFSEYICTVPTVAQNTKISPVAPRRAEVEAVVKEAYEKFKSDTNGKNADYIPYLAKVDSKLFGIAIVTTDNQVLTMGDVTYSFSIQSISKVYSLALAMNEQGPEKVLDGGQERAAHAGDDDIGRHEAVSCSAGGHWRESGNFGQCSIRYIPCDITWTPTAKR